jgi:putative hydrolase of the HAD superfamily
VVTALRRAIIWDFEGTLGRRTPGAWSRCSIEVLDQHEPGHGIAFETIRPFLQSGFPWHSPAVPHPDLSAPDAWWASARANFARAYEGVGIAPARAKELADLFRECYLDPQRWELFPETRSVLERVRAAGVRSVILSNHVPELGEILARLDVDVLVDGVVNSAAIGYEKPNPEAFRLARAAAGEVEDLWMIGDRYDADIEGAEAVGIPAILVRGHDPRAARHAVDLVEAYAIIAAQDVITGVREASEKKR